MMQNPDAPLEVVPVFMDNRWDKNHRVALRLSFAMLDDLGLPSMRYTETIACPSEDDGDLIKTFAKKVGAMVENTVLSEYGVVVP